MKAFDAEGTEIAENTERELLLLRRAFRHLQKLFVKSPESPGSAPAAGVRVVRNI